jgi:hypothetical protein
MAADCQFVFSRDIHHYTRGCATLGNDTFRSGAPGSHLLVSPKTMLFHGGRLWPFRLLAFQDCRSALGPSDISGGGKRSTGTLPTEKIRIAGPDSENLLEHTRAARAETACKPKTICRNTP